MTQQDKANIAALLGGFAKRHRSQNKAATTLAISSATVSKIINGQYETISDEMWRMLGHQLGYNLGGWQTVETSGYRELYAILTDAQADAQVFGVVGDAGSGKTTTIKQYEASHQHTYHIKCSEFWAKKTFLGVLGQTLGISPSSSDGLAESLQAIVAHLKRQERPLIIIDEADKLSDQVLYLFISLYNELEDACGLVLIATQCLEERIVRGVRLGRRGFAEIYSRLGRRFIALPLPSDEDISHVCRANGIEGVSDIRHIIESSQADLRRVKRMVYALTKAGQSA